MNAIIINIGDELLIGQVTNFNASWMAEQLTTIGIEVIRINVIPDKEEDIIASLNESGQHADLVLITGGLGPTNDDITKETLCKYFNLPLIFNEDVYKDILDIFSRQGLSVTEINRKQAEVPEGCKIIRNTQGTASGIWFEKDEKIFIATPGVPFEMKPMMTDSILPLLEKRMKGDVIVHKTVLTHGIGESFLADKIASWENALPSNTRLAYLPAPGIVRLRLTARGSNKDILIKTIDEEVLKLQELISANIYGYNTDSMEQIIGKLLIQKGKTLATAESCTGGYIAHRITNVQGSSSYYMGSVIAYANEIKENLLDVKHKTLEKYGAVSEETVIEMAANVRIKLHADFSIAVSGIAGPDGGTPEKPVGTVWIAVASPDNIIAQKFRFGTNRIITIEQASITALNMLRKAILKYR
jgi:nicotinamide-nucleotide amidase